MTINKFIRKLLFLKGLYATNFQFKIRDRVLNLWVKPYKNGCLCPSVNVVVLLYAQLTHPGDGVIFQCVAGPFSFGAAQGRFHALPMAGFKKISPGQIPMRV